MLWDEQHDKSDYNKEGDDTMNRYNRCLMKMVMMMNFGVLNKFADFSVSYTWVRL